MQKRGGGGGGSFHLHHYLLKRHYRATEKTVGKRVGQPMRGNDRFDMSLTRAI